MNENHIKKLDEAKNRLGAVIRACHGAARSLDAFFAEVVPDGPEKPDWETLPPERHLLYDCRGNIHDLRRQARRLVFQILHVKRIEMRRFRAKKETSGKGVAQAGGEERFRDVFNDARELIAKTDGR